MISYVNNDFEKWFFKLLLNSSMFSKTMENVKKYRNIKQVNNDKMRNYVRFSIVDLSKILIYEFWYDCIKKKYNIK